MDQELQTIIQNIEALVQQAKQAAGADTSVEKDGIGEDEEVTPDMLEKIMRAMGDEGTPKDPKMNLAEQIKNKLGKIKKTDDADADEQEEEVAKSKKVRKTDDNDEDEKDLAVAKSIVKLIRKSAEGATATDDAEERYEETDPEAEANINEVAKTIANLMAGKRSVKKSKDAEYRQVIKSLAGEMQQLKSAVAGILDGIGVTEQIKSQSAVAKSKPMNNLDEIQKSLDAVKALAGKQVEVDNGIGDTSHYVAKSLASDGGSLLRGIFHRNAR